MEGSFSVGDSFSSGEVTPLGLHLLLWEKGSKKIDGAGDTPIMILPTRAKSGLCCNRILKNMNYNMLWKIYEKRILTLQALLHRSIFQTFTRSVQHVSLMVDFKP